MTKFFTATGLGTTDISLRCLGGISPALVNATYPMEALTNFHYAHHIPGLTGRWMDTGATALGGAVKGSFHRLTHGHHLFEDGFKVVVNPDLKFGEFLHHLGMDSLTARGIPNPLLPTAVGEQLVKLGMSQTFVNELLTVNVPKVLGGSLALVCAGKDVFLAFSDAIPHTFLAAGTHFGLGALDIALGLYPPNFLLLTAGAAEIGVGIATTYRTIVDPILPVVGVPASVFLPALGQSVALGTLIGACASIFTGDSWADVPKTVATSVPASAVHTLVTFAASANGFLGPFIGPVAAIATAILMRKMLDAVFPTTEPKPIYEEYINKEDLNVFQHETVIPMPGIAKEPIGMLKDDRFLLNEASVRQVSDIWATDDGQH
ncbi:MAG: hypothetical protein OXH63_10035 [Gemmatimonadetes bacterium]|nr:hypothetical protein [Gemmatimonadota bacterium]